MSTINVLGVDPGFASVGCAVVSLGAVSERVLSMDVIRTQKANKRNHVYAADDNVRRAQEIARTVARVLAQYKCVAVTAEAMSFPRNASNAAKMALTWGVIAALALHNELPIVQATPMAIKRAVTGDKTASKEAIQAALRRRYTDATDFDGAVPRSEHEHMYDALGSVVACLDSEVIRLARKMIGK